jgi:hypothetical protein
MEMVSFLVKKTVKKILEKTGLGECNSCKIPMEPKTTEQGDHKP